MDKTEWEHQTENDRMKGQQEQRTGNKLNESIGKTSVEGMRGRNVDVDEQLNAQCKQ